MKALSVSGSDSWVFRSIGAALIFACAGWLSVPAYSQAVSFSRTDYPVGEDGGGIVAADFNHDGKLDLVQVRSTTNNIAYFQGLGNGTFLGLTSFSISAAGANPGPITAADFNLDGHLDIAVAHPSTTGAGYGNTVTISLGNGAGAFSVPAFVFSTGGTHLGIDAGDINGDGKPDLVVASCDSGGIWMHLGSGSGTFTYAGQLAMNYCGAAVFGVKLTDLNSDGKLDVVTGNGGDSGHVSVFLATGPASFGPRVRYPFPGGLPEGLAIADFNQDGKPDLVVTAANSSTVSVMIGNGLGGLTHQATATGCAGPRAVVAADFDGDGNMDAAAPCGQAAGTIAVFRGNGAGGLASPTSFAVGNAPLPLAAGDFNQDGRPDIAVNNYYGQSISVLLNSTSGDNTPPVIIANISGLLGNNGWYRGPVTVTWSVSDAQSPITASSGCDPATLNADTVGTTVACTATSLGGTSTQSVTVKIDQTAPAIGVSQSPLASAAGWNNTNVTVTFACSDALSGLAIGGTAAVVSAEGSSIPISHTCSDQAGNTASASASLNIDKTPPSLTNLLIAPNPQAVGGSVGLTGLLTDLLSGLKSWQYEIDDSSPSLNPASGGSFPISKSLTFNSPDVYKVCVIGTDVAGNPSLPECAYSVIYDPTGGFVTGGGWFNSPAGAFPANPVATGKANFGFVSKYLKGATVPTGETQFQFRAGALDFKSTSYEWLVVAGARAQYKGLGTVNGAPGFRFMLTAIDGELPGGGGVDKIRIRIWNDSGLVYDNQVGADDDADPSTQLGGGSIVIHKP